MGKQQGFSITELLIVSLIGSIVLTAVINHYLQAKIKFITINKQLANSTDILLISELLQDSIRRAGFTPCQNINYLITPNPKIQDIQIPLSNHIKIKRMAEEFNTVEQTSDLSVKASKDFLLNKDQKIMIADCFHAEILSVESIFTDLTSQWLQLTKPLQFHYQKPIFVGPWIEEEFQLNKNIFYYGQQHMEAISNNLQNVNFEFKTPNVINTILKIENMAEINIATKIRSR